MTYDLKFISSLAPRTRQHMTSDNESVTKVIASFYRDDSDTVYLGFCYDLRSDIIPANVL